MKPGRRLLRILAAIITSLAAAVLTASTPAGAVQYQITPIVNNTTVLNFPHINNYGQIVWASPNSVGQFQLNLYNNGTITQIGDDFSPGCLDINDRGEIVWGAMSGGGFHLYSNGTISKIASGIGVGWLKINNKSQIVYDNGTDIYLYSNGTSTPIHIGGGPSNIDPDINDKAQIVWSGYDGNEFQIYLHDNGTTTKLTNYSSATGNSQSLANPKINNNGQVVWTGYDTNSGYNIYLWESDSNGGKTTKISNGGSDYYPDINDFGQVVWMGGTSIIYLWNINNPGSNPIQIGSGSRICPTINNAGQIVYYSGSGTDIYLATPQVEVAKKVYGIFIGSEHKNPLPSGAIARLDLGAQLLQRRFSSITGYDFGNSKLLTTKMADGGVKRSKVLEAISDLKKNFLKPGDGLILYVCCHGAALESLVSPTTYVLCIGSERDINHNIDTINEFPNDYITDSNLKEMLSGMDDIQKWIFIDSCHSGGFYNSIHSLTNASLIASATERGLAWSSDLGTGKMVAKGGLFTTALDTGLGRDSNGKVILDADPKDPITFDEILKYIQEYKPRIGWVGSVVYELGFGDPAVFTLDMWNPTGFRTADFVGGFSTNRKDISPILFLLLD